MGKRLIDADMLADEIESMKISVARGGQAVKLGSLFDGSGGFPLAGSLCGIEPVWAAEVEPYPIAVTLVRCM